MKEEMKEDMRGVKGIQDMVGKIGREWERRRKIQELDGESLRVEIKEINKKIEKIK